jgi:hypothetical protein
MTPPTMDPALLALVTNGLAPLSVACRGAESISEIVGLIVSVKEEVELEVAVEEALFVVEASAFAGNARMRSVAAALPQAIYWYI